MSELCYPITETAEAAAILSFRMKYKKTFQLKQQWARQLCWFCCLCVNESPVLGHLLHTSFFYIICQASCKAGLSDEWLQLCWFAISHSVKESTVFPSEAMVCFFCFPFSLSFVFFTVSLILSLATSSCSNDHSFCLSCPFSQSYQWLKEKIVSEDGRKQQAKLKELNHIAEKLGCTLPQLAVGKAVWQILQK